MWSCWWMTECLSMVVLPWTAAVQWVCARSVATTLYQFTERQTWLNTTAHQSHHGTSSLLHFSAFRVSINIATDYWHKLYVENCWYIKLTCKYWAAFLHQRSDADAGGLGIRSAIVVKVSPSGIWVTLHYITLINLYSASTTSLMR